MKARRVLFGLILAATVVVVPGATGTPMVASAKADCLQSYRTQTDHPGDEDDPAESVVVQEETSIEKNLQDAYDKQTLPRRLLVKGADGEVHAKLDKGSVKIPVYVHVVHVGTTGQVPKAEIDKQIAQLNKDYAGTPANFFAFQLMTTDDTNNKQWFQAVANSDTDKAMKRKLHKGKANDLNLYFNDPGEKTPGDGRLLGYATWPWDFKAKPNLDGVVVKYNTVPGGALEPYDEGKTATHEVGHWLGLLHTFQGACNAPGDEVTDTPAEAGPTEGCPTGLKACDGKTPAPVHNFMDYSDDHCLTQFTKGQAQRAADHWMAYRYPRTA